MSNTAPKDERLYIRVNGKLKKSVQEYCAVNGVELTDLVTRFFEKIVEKERKRKSR